MHMPRFVFPVLLATASGASQAAITLYTDETAYLAAMGATLRYVDFNPSPQPPAIVSGNGFGSGLAFGTCTEPADILTCASKVLHGDNAITDTGGSLALNGVAALGASVLLADAYGVAFNYNSGDIRAVNYLNLAGVLLETVDTTSANGFIGLVSSSPFAFPTYLIAVNAVIPGTADNDRYFFTDFRVNAPIPEPATYGLMALGLAGVGLMAKRRRSA
ncbi:MAG: PEP-CTERM sorting domain-containing protein [Burkholderiales bacterium]|nr:PEP-CTERM sorting domain-containing protein [Burkholderiales bacterium]